MSATQQQLPRGSVQSVQDAINKGLPLKVGAEVTPDTKVDLAKQQGEHIAFPVDPGMKSGFKPHDSKVNYHQERDTVQYRRGADDNIKYAGREDLFSGQPGK